MLNEKLRDYLFEIMYGETNICGMILFDYYNEKDCKIPDDIVLMAHKELLEWILDLEWISLKKVMVQNKL